MRLFFATDVHGSEICWKKFLAGAKFYEVDTLILGGDMTGKAVIPIIAQGNNKWKVTLLEQESIIEGKEEVDKWAQNIQNRGYYPYVSTPDEVAEIAGTPGRSDEVFLEQVLRPSNAGWITPMPSWKVRISNVMFAPATMTGLRSIR